MSSCKISLLILQFCLQSYCTLYFQISMNYMFNEKIINRSIFLMQNTRNKHSMVDLPGSSNPLMNFSITCKCFSSGLDLNQPLFIYHQLQLQLPLICHWGRFPKDQINQSLTSVIPPNIYSYLNINLRLFSPTRLTHYQCCHQQPAYMLRQYLIEDKHPLQVIGSCCIQECFSCNMMLCVSMTSEGLIRNNYKEMLYRNYSKNSHP